MNKRREQEGGKCGCRGRRKGREMHTHREKMWEEKEIQKGGGKKCAYTECGETFSQRVKKNVHA